MVFITTCDARMLYMVCKITSTQGLKLVEVYAWDKALTTYNKPVDFTL